MENKTLLELINLTGKTAIVTGGAKGIGRGIANRLHEAGANIVLADVDETEAHATATEFSQRRDGSVYVVPCDVSHRDDVQRAVDTAVEQFGGLDILVNNAGIFPFAALSDLTDELFDKVLATNLRSVYLFTKIASERMIQQGNGGKIINVASVDALHPSMVGLAAYDASKHGVWGFTKNTALELAEHKIWVNAIAPGGVATPGVAAMMGGDLEKAKAQNSNVPMSRMGEPDDMGRVALFLASDLSSYMTGSIVVADGGMLLK